ncbi:MAG TPA: hypothetical protein VI168_13150 [Croceibacterium sp.]
MKTPGFLTAAILLATAGSVAAQTEGEQAAGEQAVSDLAAVEQAAVDQQAAAEQERRICKTEKITGSRTRVRRTCMTQREWSRLAEGSNDLVEDLERDMARAMAVPSPAINGR